MRVRGRIDERPGDAPLVEPLIDEYIHFPQPA